MIRWVARMKQGVNLANSLRLLIRRDVWGHIVWTRGGCGDGKRGA